MGILSKFSRTLKGTLKGSGSEMLVGYSTRRISDGHGEKGIVIRIARGVGMSMLKSHEGYRNIETEMCEGDV